MESIQPIIIGLAGVIISIAGSGYITFKALTKKHTEEWLIQLRDALSSFLAIGGYIPLGSTTQELWEYRKRMFLVQMLLEGRTNKEHKELMLKVSNLQNSLMTKYNERKTLNAEYSKLMSDVMTQYYKVVDIAKKNRKKPIE